MEKLNEDAETKRAVGTCKDRRDCASRVNFALILCEILTNMHLPFFRQKLEIFRTGRKKIRIRRRIFIDSLWQDRVRQSVVTSLWNLFPSKKQVKLRIFNLIKVAD